MEKLKKIILIVFGVLSIIQIILGNTSYFGYIMLITYTITSIINIYESVKEGKKREAAMIFIILVVVLIACMYEVFN